jgi:hypothetical protein
LSFKQVIFILIFALPLVTRAQSKSPIELTVTHERLQKTRDIHELLSDIPIDCKIIRFELTFKSNGRILNIPDLYADTLKNTNYWRTSLAKTEPGSKIYVNVKRTDCKTLVGKIFAIKVLKNL